MYKIVSFRYESVIQKNFARLCRAKFFFAPPNHKSVPTALLFILSLCPSWVENMSLVRTYVNAVCVPTVKGGLQCLFESSMATIGSVCSVF